MNSLYALLFLACAAYTCASIIDEDALEKELQNAEFKDAQITFDDSDEVGGRADKKEKKRCSCKSHTSCGCCLKPRIGPYKFRGCANMTVFPADKVLEVTLNFEGNQIAQYNVSIARAERICDRLPGKISFLKLCLYTNNTETAEDGLKSCTSLDIIVKNTTAAIINFSCIQFKDNQLSFSTHQELDREGMLNIKFKNPIASIIKLFKKKKTEE